MELRDDSHANQLRATLMNINEPMDSVSDKLTLALVKAHNFYAHKWKATSAGGTTHVTKELASKLLEPEFQASAIKKAREAATQAAEAAKVVREDVIPLLPRLEADLENYLLDYTDRTTAIEERRRSWIPSFFLNLIWGTVDPTPWHLNEVQGLQHRLSAANYQLRRLPAFFDNLELHFKRLSELSSEKLPGLGYTTSDDLVRLYQDRIKCDQILRHMDNSWYSAGRAFAFGALKNLP
ncbi:hypothetical protein M408DRAFT_334148 [Serendipita vermifera MAFF 305830]|uniref:Uncharacterized protein n=1 Tax=Serendipita vermifera MAFF 305830 TaxID=933852 RepID=A0A0C3AJ44_SERVB|nr:hypothetical protein M408DRAFT_334148 [Serendipita vermifera MAFF 305830]